MSLTERAKKDARRILENKAEWAIDVALTAPGEPDDYVAEVTGTTSRRHVQVSAEGVEVNGSIVNVSVFEAAIKDKNPNYPVRDDKGEVAMIGHRVKVSDVSGERNYYVRETYPDETLGIIVLILGDHTD